MIKTRDNPYEGSFFVTSQIQGHYVSRPPKAGGNRLRPLKMRINMLLSMSIKIIIVIILFIVYT